MDLTSFTHKIYLVRMMKLYQMSVIPNRSQNLLRDLHLKQAVPQT